MTKSNLLHPESAALTPKQILQIQMMFAGAFLVVGIIALLGGIALMKDYVDSRHWPSTSGSVADSSIFMLQMYDSDEYIVTIDYNYQVNGQTYTNTRIASNEGFCVYTGCKPDNRFGENESAAQHFLAQYPIGKPVTVLYNPNNPERAFLERRLPIIGVLFVILGLVITPTAGIIFFERTMNYDRLQTAEQQA